MHLNINRNTRTFKVKEGFEVCQNRKGHFIAMKSFSSKLGKEQKL